MKTSGNRLGSMGCFEGMCFKRSDPENFRPTSRQAMQMGMPSRGRWAARPSSAQPAEPTPAASSAPSPAAPSRRPGDRVAADNARQARCAALYSKMSEADRGAINALFAGKAETPVNAAAWCDAVEQRWGQPAPVAPGGAVAGPPREEALRELISVFRRLPRSAQLRVVRDGEFRRDREVQALAGRMAAGDWGEHGAPERFVSWLERNYNPSNADSVAFRRRVLALAPTVGVSLAVPFVVRPAGRVRPGGELVPRFDVTTAEACRAIPGGSWDSSIEACYVDSSGRAPGPTAGPADSYPTEAACMEAGGLLIGDGATAQCQINGRTVPIGTGAPGADVDHTAEYVNLIGTGLQSAATIVGQVLQNQNAAEARQFAATLQAQQQQFQREAQAGNQASALALQRINAGIEQMRLQTAQANERAALAGQPQPFPPDVLAILAQKNATPTWVWVAGGVAAFGLVGAVVVMATRPPQQLPPQQTRPNPGPMGCCNAGVPMGQGGKMIPSCGKRASIDCIDEDGQRRGYCRGCAKGRKRAPKDDRMPRRENPADGDEYEYVELDGNLSPKTMARLDKLLDERLPASYPIEAHANSEDARSLAKHGVKPSGKGDYGKDKYVIPRARMKTLVKALVQSGGDNDHSLGSGILQTLEIGLI